MEINVQRCLLQHLYIHPFQGKARIFLDVWHRWLEATGRGCVSKALLRYIRSTCHKYNLAQGQGSISMGTIVRIASSFPRRTTTFKVLSFFTVALTSVADEILCPLMEMITSCCLSPPLKDRRKILNNASYTECVSKMSQKTHFNEK